MYEVLGNVNNVQCPYFDSILLVKAVSKQQTYVRTQDVQKLSIQYSPLIQQNQIKEIPPSTLLCIYVDANRSKHIADVLVEKLVAL